MLEELPLLPEPDRLIALNPEKREFLERKQHEYRERSERAVSGDVQDVVDDAYYKLVVLGILLRDPHRHVTIGDAFDEIASADGEDNVKNQSSRERIWCHQCVQQRRDAQSHHNFSKRVAETAFLKGQFGGFLQPFSDTSFFFFFLLDQASVFYTMPQHYAIYPYVPVAL